MNKLTSLFGGVIGILCVLFVGAAFMSTGSDLGTMVIKGAITSVTAGCVGINAVKVWRL